MINILGRCLKWKKKIKIIPKWSKVSSISVSQRLNKITIYYFAEETLEIINAENIKIFIKTMLCKREQWNKITEHWDNN